MEMHEVELGVMRAYEHGRWRRALGYACVLLAALTPFAAVAPMRLLGIGLTAMLFVACAGALWRGLEWESGFVRGLWAGLVPLAFALVARPFGHGCEIGGHCFSWCMPACAVGGVVAALSVARGMARVKRPSFYALSAASSTLGLGALGCACVSASGALALAVAFVLASVPCVVWAERSC